MLGSSHRAERETEKQKELSERERDVLKCFSGDSGD